MSDTTHDRDDEALLRDGIAASAGDDHAHRAALGADLTARLERGSTPSEESIPAWLARDMAVAWLRLGRWADTVGSPGEVLASFDASSVAGTDWPRTDATRHRRVFEAIIARLGIAAPDVATILAKHHVVEARLLRRRRLLDALRASLRTEGGRLTRDAVRALVDVFLPGIPDDAPLEAAVTRTSVVLLAPAAAGAALARWFPALRRGYDAHDGDPARIAALARSAGLDTEEVTALLGDCVRAVLTDDLDAALLRETYGRLGAGDLVRAVHWRDPRRGSFLPPTMTGVATRGPLAERLLDALHVDREGVVRVDVAALDEVLDRWCRARVEGEVPSVLAELAADAIARHASLFRARDVGAAPADVFLRTRQLLAPLLDDLRPLVDDLGAPRTLDRLAAEAAWALPLREPARLPRGLDATAMLRLRDALTPVRDGAARLAGDWLSERGAVGGDGGHNALGALWRGLARVQCRLDAQTSARRSRTPSQATAGRDLTLLLFLVARQAERGRGVADMDDFLARYAARVVDLVASVERAHGFSDGDRRDDIA